MTITKEQRLAQVHQECLREMGAIQSASRDVRLQCLQARRFYSVPGAQWEGPLGDQFENKPRFEFNKSHLAVIRVFNEYRANRIAVDFQSKDGQQADELAESLNGIYRSDWRSCSGDEAGDNCFEEGVGGGFGAIRVRAKYEDEEDEENEKQRVVFEPIFDADSTVFFGLDAKRYDKADAKSCYVLTPYTVDGYRETWNDDPSSWPKLIHQNEFDWYTPRLVWVAEVYKLEESNEAVRIFRGLDGQEERVTKAETDDDPEVLERLQATGYHEVRQKKVKRRRWHKYIMSGGGILEDCGFIAGRCCPIVPFYAKRWVVDGIERCVGHVQLAMDAQRLQNMLLSWLAEMATRFDIEKPIVTPEQVAGHAAMWANDNVAKYPYLLLNTMTDKDGNAMPPNQLQYTKAPNIPPAVATLTQIAGQALEDMLGNQQAGEEIQPNLSGKAVELIQNRLDMQVFIYMSNFAKTHKRLGEVWLSMMKDVAVEDSRRMKTLSDTGEVGSVVLNQPKVDDDGAQIMANDIARANYEVDVDVGPSSVSKRAATVRALTGILQMTQDPGTQQVLLAAAMMNMDGEGLDDIRAYYRRMLVQQGVVKPTPEEQQQLEQAAANQQPDPQSQYLMAAADQAQADAASARAKTVDTIASAHLKQAQTVKTMREAQGLPMQHAANFAKSMQSFAGLQ